MLTTWSSHRIVSRSFNLHHRLVLWLVGLLLLTKFSPIPALLTVLVVSLQVALGESVLGRFSGFNQISRLSKVGLGFCIGATVSTFFYVFVVTFTSAMVAMISQIILFVFTSLLRWTQIGSTNVQATSEEIGAVKWLVVAALLGLSPNWFWTLPVAIWLAILFLVWSRLSNAQIVFKIAFAILSCGSGLLIYLRITETRPERAWFADDRFAEVFSFSLGKWGISYNPMLISESISYHWFSFAWIGVVSNLTFTKVDLVLALFAPVIVAMACVILGFAIIKTFTTNTTIAICSLALAVSVDTERLFEGYGFNSFQMSSFSQFFSLALGLSVLLIIINLDTQQLFSVAVIVGVIFAGLMGSKISSGLVVSFGLVGIWLVDLIKQRGVQGNLRFFLHAIIIPVIFAIPLFYGDPRNGSGSPIRRPGWPVGVYPNLWDIYNGSFERYLPILIFLMLAFGSLGFLGLLITMRSKFNFIGFHNSQIFLGFGLFASFVQMWIRGGAGSRDLFEGNVSTLYAFHYGISLVRFVAIAVVLQQFSTLYQAKKLRKMLIGLGFCYLLALPIIRSWDINYEPSYSVPLLTTFKLVIPLVLALLMGTFIWLFVRNKWKSLGYHSRPKIFLVISNMALITAGLFLFASNFISVSSRQQHEWRSMDAAYFVTDDFEAATTWLKINTPDDVVIASKVTRVSPRIAVLTGRKDFAGVQVSFRIFGENSAVYERNYHLVEQFGKTGSCDSASGLRESDVDFFLVDFSNPDTADISRCADEVFRNKGAAVYKLS